MNISSEDPEENWIVFQKVVHSSAATIIGHQGWFDENDKENKLLLEENTACTRHTKMILALYQRTLPTAIFVRQSKTGSVTCKTPG